MKHRAKEAESKIEPPVGTTWFEISEGHGPVAVAGMAMLAHRPAVERYVHSVWVAPDRRGNSLSTALLAAVKIAARAEKAERLMLWVFCENTHAAAVFTHLGFYPSGGLHRYVDGRLEQMYLLDLEAQ